MTIKPDGIKLDEMTVPELHGMHMNLERAITNSRCPECQPPPEVLQALTDVEDEIASRGL